MRGTIYSLSIKYAKEHHVTLDYATYYVERYFFTGTMRGYPPTDIYLMFLDGIDIDTVCVYDDGYKIIRRIRDDY